MPSRVNTPFSSTMQPDAFDRGDEFSAQLRQRQAEALQERMDRMGMFNADNNWRNNAIGEQRHEFDTSQGNNKSLAMAMLQARRDEMGVERDRFGKQFDYMKGQSDLENQRWQKQFDALAAGRAASDAATGAQTRMLLAQLAQMEEDNKRHVAARNVGDPADLATAPAEVVAQFQQDKATSDPATAVAKYQATMAARKKEEADAAGEKFGMDVGAFSTRDNKVFGIDPTEQDKGVLRTEFRNLVDQLTGSGMSRTAAANKARVIFSQNSKHSSNSSWVDDLSRELGVNF